MIVCKKKMPKRTRLIQKQVLQRKETFHFLNIFLKKYWRIERSAVSELKKVSRYREF